MITGALQGLCSLGHKAELKFKPMRCFQKDWVNMSWGLSVFTGAGHGIRGICGYPDIMAHVQVMSRLCHMSLYELTVARNYSTTGHSECWWDYTATLPWPWGQSKIVGLFATVGLFPTVRTAPKWIGQSHPWGNPPKRNVQDESQLNSDRVLRSQWLLCWTVSSCCCRKAAILVGSEPNQENLWLTSRTDHESSVEVSCTGGAVSPWSSSTQAHHWLTQIQC